MILSRPGVWRGTGVTGAVCTELAELTLGELFRERIDFWRPLSGARRGAGVTGALI